LSGLANTSETVGSLILNGTSVAAGTYTAAQLTAFGSTATFSSTNGETLTVVGVVPEPSTYACVFIAVAGLGVYARNRRTRHEA
ncbi:MAG: PEP-CTERM sorting domain-containing protein, partial [Rhodospirillales bacterium]|nr:PEP-CTERM sorting domain-containing protein [Acetobacter sp.]